jgi:hypothetical protein
LATGVGDLTIGPMKKRLVAGSLWFLAILAMYELAWSLAGVPRQVGPMLAFVVSALVVADPANLFWPARSTIHTRTPRLLRSESTTPVLSK